MDHCQNTFPGYFNTKEVIKLVGGGVGLNGPAIYCGFPKLRGRRGVIGLPQEIIKKKIEYDL